jgi:RimJ/RimL family protein N-acetyltransferase
MGKKLTFRRMAAGDIATLTAVFAGMSDDDRALRYLTPMPLLPSGTATRLVELADGRHEAWVAAIDDVPVGISRFIRVGPDVAEVAVEVVTASQRQGIATILLALTRGSALACGIQRFTAVADSTNRAVVGLLRKHGIHFRVDGPLLEVVA